MLREQIIGAKVNSPEIKKQVNLTLAHPMDENDNKFASSDILLAKDVHSSISTATSPLKESIDKLDAVIDVNGIIITDRPDNYVDLGLPSGKQWRGFNVGSTSMTDAGKFYQWGDTEGFTLEEAIEKKGYVWDNYKYSDGSSKTLTKYCTLASYGKNNFVDNKTVLEDSDAAVSVEEQLSMPTLADATELLQNTDVYLALKGGTAIHGMYYHSGNMVIWDRQPAAENISGCEFRDKKDATNKLFIPVCGVIGNETCGGIWLKDMPQSMPDRAQVILFTQQYCIVTPLEKCYSVPVRGITDKPVAVVPNKSGTLVMTEDIGSVVEFDQVTDTTDYDDLFPVQE